MKVYTSSWCWYQFVHTLIRIYHTNRSNLGFVTQNFCNAYREYLQSRLVPFDTT
jgi:hypothetical protein